MDPGYKSSLLGCGAPSKNWTCLILNTHTFLLSPLNIFMRPTLAPVFASPYLPHPKSQHVIQWEDWSRKTWSRQNIVRLAAMGACPVLKFLGLDWPWICEWRVKMQFNWQCRAAEGFWWELSFWETNLTATEGWIGASRGCRREARYFYYSPGKVAGKVG